MTADGGRTGGGSGGCEGGILVGLKEELPDSLVEETGVWEMKSYQEHRELTKAGREQHTDRASMWGAPSKW